MRHSHFFRAALLLLLFSPAALHAQEPQYPAYDTTAEELADIQRVIDATLPDVEAMLKKKGSFLPFATVILANDSIADIAVKDSAKAYTADDLKEELSIDALKGAYKAVVIFSAGRINDPSDGKETKAVLVFAEHTNDDFAYLFYYPYKITARKEVIFGESFGDFAPQVMFKP
ncbi:hypothetical protein [Taibaiella koreensis]|uniref:hypothetical protein n=1 Tax=Taibaiella koreensis TaxID=1268548 RepID=UPI0013C2BF4D|nr:hypothetical protein [Taibaiella koreensis]